MTSHCGYPEAKSRSLLRVMLLGTVRHDEVAIVALKVEGLELARQLAETVSIEEHFLFDRTEHSVDEPNKVKSRRAGVDLSDDNTPWPKRFPIRAERFHMDRNPFAGGSERSVVRYPAKWIDQGLVGFRNLSEFFRGRPTTCIRMVLPRESSECRTNRSVVCINRNAQNVVMVHSGPAKQRFSVNYKSHQLTSQVEFR